MPCSAVHTAVARVPDPHQMRSARPGDWGRMARGWLTPVICGSLMATPAPAIAARNSSVCARARSASVVPSCGTKPNDSEPRSAVSGDPRLTPSCSRPARDEVGGRGLLGHVERVLVAHVDHAGAEFDLRRAGGHGGEQRKRRRELAGEVVHAHVRAVDTDLLGGNRQFDHLQVRVGRGSRQRSGDRLPVTEGEEPDFLHVHVNA